VRLGSRDLDRSAAFYRDLLGFDEVPVPGPDTRRSPAGATPGPDTRRLNDLPAPGPDTRHIAAGATPGPGTRRLDDLPAPGPETRCFAAGGVRLLVTEVGPGADLGGWVDDDLQGGIRHFGMKVGDIDARVRGLAAAGVTVLSPPADVLGGVRIAFFLDPDGARLEFVQGNLTYQHVSAPDLAAAEAATRVAPGERPRFDHVAITVEDLPAALRELDHEVIGEIRHHDDPRGFLMTYLRAGPAVLEVFSFDAPVRPRPLAVAGVLGFQGIDFQTSEADR
jgi:catechol 2,3-dioxygenase-like lactoylglutathione lyase family enzyme